MLIKDGRVKGVRYVPANAIGGPMAAPKFIVVHETAGRIEKGSSVKWFASKECKVSAHFCIERDGEVVQHVPLDRRAYHAGASRWKNISGLNSCSIGIELVGPGKMDSDGKAWFGPCCKPQDIEFRSTASHGDGWWLPFTSEQIAALKLLCFAITEEFETCNEIVGHYEISPGRKVDPNPLLSLRDIRKAALDPDPEAAEKIEEVLAPPVVPPASKKIEAAKEIAKEGAQSFSVRAMFLGLMAWIETQFSFLRGMLPDAQKEVTDVVSPLTSLGAMLKINLAGILAVVVVVVIVVVIYRHSRDKAELRKLKGE